jgi:hypothetical protein
MEQIFFDQAYRGLMVLLSLALILMGGDAMRWIWGRRHVHRWAYVPIIMIGYLIHNILADLAINIISFLMNQEAPPGAATWIYRYTTWTDLIVMAAVYIIMKKGLGEKAKLEENEVLRP